MCVSGRGPTKRFQPDLASDRPYKPAKSSILGETCEQRRARQYGIDVSPLDVSDPTNWNAWTIG